mmetsp:Transcript_25598/g.31481  ORF Transcript_25598/g.31481 Transcript_25598/m.31481 type:complete len:472 (-) Transcript_25598:207-1622(-)
MFLRSSLNAAIKPVGFRFGKFAPVSVRLGGSFLNSDDNGSAKATISSASSSSQVTKAKAKSDEAEEEKKFLPDFNTSVDVVSHSLGVSKAQKARKLRRKLLKENQVKGSLIDDTLKTMETDETFKLTAARLKEWGQENLTRKERKHRNRALGDMGVKSFNSFLDEHGVPHIGRTQTEVFQINVGLYCNQACSHCHVESSPRKKKEQMDHATAERCIELIKASPTVTTVDITGGAPELNDEFRYLATEARALGKNVIDRCNLTVLTEPGQEDLVDFLADNKIHVVASLPCYGPQNVDMQRGNGVFERSIVGLLKLNERGYGVEGSDLTLDLVYNPIGPFLPPEQTALEAKYKQELADAYGIQFNSLFTITNMPIKRFADFLHRRGELKDYMELLVRNFNPSACETAMCTNYISVDYNGKIYDCDFNQQLAMSLKNEHKSSLSIFDIDSTDDIMEKKNLDVEPLFWLRQWDGF